MLFISYKNDTILISASAGSVMYNNVNLHNLKIIRLSYGYFFSPKIIIERNNGIDWIIKVFSNNEEALIAYKMLMNIFGHELETRDLNQMMIDYAKEENKCQNSQSE